MAKTTYEPEEGRMEGEEPVGPAESVAGDSGGVEPSEEEDDGMPGALSEDQAKRLKAFEEQDAALKRMFVKDPRSAAFFTAWQDGENPLVALVRHYGPELRDQLDDPELADKLAQALKDYGERMASTRQYEQDYARNMEESMDEIDRAQRENGWTDEQTDEAFSALVTIVADGINGRFTAESMKLAMDGTAHDGDVERARVAGQVDGRNQKITSERRTARKGDGVPSLQGSGARTVEEGGARDIFDMAMQAQGRNT